MRLFSKLGSNPFCQPVALVLTGCQHLYQNQPTSSQQVEAENQFQPTR